jgi:signal transduction histidine kinase
MKKKLNILFVLISLALAGIIVFQAYWSVNAYKVNKTKFNADIDVAMQRAMDDCKKDYFDSVRVVLVKRLSDTNTIKITIDTLHEADTIHKQLTINIKNNRSDISQPFHITSNQLDYYRAMIKHQNATLPEVLTETSFYVPALMNQWQLILGMQDIEDHMQETQAFLKAHSNIPSDTVFARKMIKQYGIYALPVNYRQADSIRLNNYFRQELDKLNIRAGYDFYFSDRHTPSEPSGRHYSQTAEYNYRYHGFIFLGVSPRGAEFFARAVFTNPQYAVLKSMLLPLCFSVLLILFTIYCFYYIIQLVIHQKKLGELKDDFINNMTHELKTPIATITVAIEGLQKFNALNDPEKTQRYLQTANTELSRLNNLVSKVLNIAAFENKDIVLEKEKINIDDMFNEIIMSEKAKSGKNLNISYNNRDINTIYADKLHFKNILTNIIDNAIKYSNETVNITINCFKQSGKAIFAINDNGIGIPESHLNQIFDKFHRVTTGNVHNVKGTGLGLSYAKYIVNAHGGEITVKSEINKGSEFIVSIPLSNG